MIYVIASEWREGAALAEKLGARNPRHWAFIGSDYDLPKIMSAVEPRVYLCSCAHPTPGMAAVLHSRRAHITRTACP